MLYKYENLIGTHKIFVNYAATCSGSHITVDECGRIRFINILFYLRSYDLSNVEITNWNVSLNLTNWIYDILFPNYVLLVT